VVEGIFSCYDFGFHAAIGVACVFAAIEPSHTDEPSSLTYERATAIGTPLFPFDLDGRPTTAGGYVGAQQQQLGAPGRQTGDGESYRPGTHL